MPVIKADTLKDHIGQEIGVSDWIEIDQSRIDVFADVTEDHQFIHIDPERAAKETPFGGTIAHGFLSLSMLSALAGNTTLVLDGIAMGINYGFDKVRFLQPVRAGKKIRGRFVLEDATERNPGQWMLKYAVTVEIEGEDKPALMAHWLTLQIVG
ncbi:MAG: Nodulation protein N [Maricaulis sp.]|jgi:acyl dehydratase|uniref:Nodulation protein NodN n=1 Tax=Maricaulis virginensis TaxID=144022 RepID=A0A9W6MM05_9PROT|nr:MaoC family dehydratase [Maricaulis virginensis]MAZ91087.1 Nodulation protein N [Maricaulis sp.]MAZ91606.1 Nodulation protein N [Maricaulis sp.]GLK51070.1 nodulation protein NodN [Maricaulis virginensis]|tara:strand:+ start:61 stop:522 length:462 start_codon:yes stop_codon:yes gene_type:complete